MGDAPCDLLETELALDRVSAQLATDLPAHMRAFAQAYAAGAPAPPAPDVAGRASTATVGRRALQHALLADRGLALLRVVAPVVIERDAGVAAARARYADHAPSWAAYAALSALRDVVARGRFGRSCREVLHALQGADDPAQFSVASESQPSLEDWYRSDGTELDIDRAWADLAARHELRSSPAIVRADVRPRAFVVDPGREVIVVVPPRADSPASRFAVLHELGHALANLLISGGLPRVVDEAVASLIARDVERTSPIAAAMRTRRRHLASALAAVERGDLPGEEVAASPPWALWHDPMAQAAYVAAESLADRLAAAPDLAAAIAGERARIDRETVL